MNWLTIILGFTATVTVVGLLAILTWLLYTGHLARAERRLAERKGIYREVVTGLATRERALLEPEIHQLRTLRDFEALEAVLEEQARSSTERPAWLLDAYDRLGLVENYATRLRKAQKWRERAFAAELLGRVGNAKAVPALLETIQATRTEDADVREIALRALARIKDPRAVAPLVEALRKAEVWLAPRIADILGRHGEVVVDPMIAFLTETTRHPARAWAANILGELRAPRAFPVLVQALGDLDDEVRAKAAGALGRLGDRRAITYLLDTLLTDPAPFVRARIAGALGQFNEPEVIERLVRALGDPAWWVRMRSVEALEQIGPVAESPLLLALDDPDPEIRIRAAVALERLGVPARLIGQIESGDLGQDALGTLTKFAVAGAREMLAEHLHHPSAKVRGAVIDAARVAQRRDLGARADRMCSAGSGARRSGPPHSKPCTLLESVSRCPRPSIAWAMPIRRFAPKPCLFWETLAVRTSPMSFGLARPILSRWFARPQPGRLDWFGRETRPRSSPDCCETPSRRSAPLPPTVSPLPMPEWLRPSSPICWETTTPRSVSRLPGPSALWATPAR